MNGTELKNRIRRQMQDRRLARPKDIWAQESRELSGHLLDTPVYQNAQTIFAFMSISGEPDLSPVIKQALRDGKAVALPRTENDNRMNFYRIDSEDDVIPGRFNIPEPVLCDDERRMKIDEYTLVILPGLAFDLSGKRIGHGKGYYDRYLADDPYCNRMMAAFSFQEAENIPASPLDVPVNWVVTERGVIEI